MKEFENTNFEDLVESMRAAQRFYFKYRTHDALEASKKLERQVDAWLEKRHDKQMELGLEAAK